MPGDRNKTNESIAELQQRTRELLRAQQEAYVAAVKAWRAGLGKGTEMPPWPKSAPADLLPNSTELAEASYAFAAKLLADQSRFMDELSKAMSGAEKKS